MTEEECLKSSCALMKLVGCAARNEQPDKDWVMTLDLDALYETAKSQMLSAAAAEALRRAGINDARFRNAMGKAIRRVAMLDGDRQEVLTRLEEAGIRYMPLKGSLLKDLYPFYGMREMVDNDILIDKTRKQDVRQIMEGLGFTYMHGGYVHDSYFKKPLSNFEMHKQLFSQNVQKGLHDYYENVFDRLVKDEDNLYGYHFTDEDFYLYLVAHEYKHYAGGGTGLRSLVDLYIWLRAKESTMDRAYIDRELAKMGIQQYEKESRTLAFRLLEDQPLSAKEKEMLAFLVSSGTFGNMANRVENRAKEFGGGGLRYVWKRIFVPKEKIEIAFPLFAKYPVLMPVLPFYRLYKNMKRGSYKVTDEISALLKRKKKQK